MTEPSPWVCPSPDYGLSVALKENDYDHFIREFSHKTIGTDNLDIHFICEGQCPKGCEKKFELHLHKSITKTSFNKLYKHGKKYPEHCISTKFLGEINKNGNIL